MLARLFERPNNPKTASATIEQVMTRLSLSVIALLTLTLPVIAQGESHNLATTAKADTTVWFVQTEKNSQTIDMAGQMMETGQTVNRTFCISIKSVDDDGMRTVEFEALRVHGIMSLPMMGEMEFDSANPVDNDDFDGGMMGIDVGQMTDALTNVVGHKFSVKIDSFGRAKGMPSVVQTEDEKKDAAPGVADQAKILIEAAFGQRPEKEMAIGDKWAFSDDAGGNRLAMKNKIEATLVKVDADNFETKFTGSIEKGAGPDDAMEDESEEAAMAAEMIAGMEVSNGKVVGGQMLSRKDGLVTSSTLKATADVAMETQMGEMMMTTLATKVLKRTTKEKAMPKPKAEPAAEPKSGK